MEMLKLFMIKILAGKYYLFKEMSPLLIILLSIWNHLPKENPLSVSLKGICILWGIWRFLKYSVFNYLY
jgi:hypothetical protein